MDEELHRLDTASRNVLAARIRELRRNRPVWSPLAPKGHRRCQRGLVEVEFAAQNSATVEDLMDLCNLYNKGTDEARVGVRQEQVPYEDYQVEVVTLSSVEKLSDSRYADQIEALWGEYQRAIQAAAGRSKRYGEYLRLKAEFEGG